MLSYHVYHKKKETTSFDYKICEYLLYYQVEIQYLQLL